MMEITTAILVALSLCADCFAVSMCSSVTLGKIRWKEVLRVALAFAFIQTGLLFLGWLFGNLLSGFVHRISHILGFLLLLYVGGSMLIEGIRGKEEVRNLKGWKNVIMGGIATSIDALAVGAARSIEGRPISESVPLVTAVFAVTFLSVTAGIWGGKKLGEKFGRVAEIVGGLVLIGIGVTVLI